MNVKLSTDPSSAFSLAFLKMAISSVPYPYWQVVLSSPLNLGFNQGDCVTVRAAVSQGLAGIRSCGCGKCFWWVCAFFYWNHMLVVHTKPRHRLREWQLICPSTTIMVKQVKGKESQHIPPWAMYTPGEWVELEKLCPPVKLFFFSQFKLHSQSCADQNVCTSDMNMLVFSNLHQMGWYHAKQCFLDNKVNCLG